MIPIVNKLWAVDSIFNAKRIYLINKETLKIIVLFVYLRVLVVIPSLLVRLYKAGGDVFSLM